MGRDPAEPQFILTRRGRGGRGKQRPTRPETGVGAATPG